ncbi:hypothetical protein CIB95_11850 [Lottiidibacillus patelloidae]|uniref:Uncharacterized protein n=1 Tax=Lottiidibacillus patelloidae TaxID=2670334 RepID=A0A263BSB2_9BACI|nr:hypothetical protein [Lottiidibacillus patelloidae]OZM56462.1 hypothetical protein CIB95_11850 [Lottiidibacillus patelloidae]
MTKPITKEEYKKLLSFVGYGNLHEANIIVFGNEEGTGGRGVRENINVRNLFYGTENGEYEYCLDNQNWENGFWEPNTLDRQSTRDSYLNPDNPTLNKSNSPFNQTVARICLASENSDKDIDYWFQKFDDNQDAKKIIKDYVRNSLYRTKSGIQTYLVDWGPLPRPNQDWWGEEYFSISENKNNNYIKAFDFKNIDTSDHSFSDFASDVEHRLDLLRNTITNIPSNILICLGGANGFKKTALQRMFSLKDSQFTPLEIEIESEKNLSSYHSIATLPNKELHIFMLPFPAAGKVFENGNVMMSFYKQFTQKYLFPLFN